MVLCAKRRVLALTSSSDTENEDGSDTDELEPWQDFLKRTAQWADRELEKANLHQWAVQWRRRKWKWAAGLLDENNNKWSAVATKWQPLIHSSCPCGRRQARPKKRWEQDFIEFLRATQPAETKNWHELACDKDYWLSQTDAFASYCSI